MDRIKIKDTDLELSRLGLGCVKAGVKWAGQEAFDLFDAFLDMGGNVYDTARYILTGFLPREGAVNVYWDSGWHTVGSATILFW